MCAERSMDQHVKNPRALLLSLHIGKDPMSFHPANQVGRILEQRFLNARRAPPKYVFATLDPKDVRDRLSEPSRIQHFRQTTRSV